MAGLRKDETARARLVAEWLVSPVGDALVQAEAAERKYRQQLEAHFRGRLSSHGLLLARLPMMEAWSRYVSIRAASGLVEHMPVVVEGADGGLCG